MKRVDLTETPAVRMARLLQAQDARLGRLETRPTGVKHLGDDGDVVWDGPEWITDPEDPAGPLIPGPSWVTWSVKDVPQLVETLGHDLARARDLISNRVTMARPPGPWADELKPGNGEPYPEGAVWWEYDNEEDRNVVGLWVVSGQEWVSETLTDAIMGRIDVARLYASEAVIDELVASKIAVAQMTLQLLRSEMDPATGLYAIFDSFGLRVIDNDGPNNDGDPETWVKLGPDADMLLQLGVGDRKVNINSSGGVTANTGTFTELWVDGRPISGEISTTAPRGVVGYKEMIGYGVRYGSGRGYVIRFTVEVDAGRVYRLKSNSIVVENESSSCKPMLTLHLTTGSTSISNNWASSTKAESQTGSFGDFRTLPPMEHIVDLRDSSGKIKLNCAIALRNFAGSSWVQAAAPVSVARLTLEDIGTALPDAGQAYYDTSTPPEKVRTTRRWYATGWANYVRYGARDFSSAPTQGRYTTNRECYFFFDDMKGPLTGATLHRVTLFSFADHWFNNAGGTGRWHRHNVFGSVPGSSPGQTFMTETAGWPRGAARTINLNKPERDMIQGGTMRGFGFSAPDGNEYYGKFSPVLNSHFVEIDFEV